MKKSIYSLILLSTQITFCMNTPCSPISPKYNEQELVFQSQKQKLYFEHLKNVMVLSQRDSLESHYQSTTGSTVEHTTISEVIKKLNTLGNKLSPHIQRIQPRQIHSK